MSSLEFQVESHISTKQLNHQSVSLVIPRLTRDKVHHVLYYKVNLEVGSLRGDTMLQLSKVLIRDLGTIKANTLNQTHILGGVEFKCLLMKLVEIRPTREQLVYILETQNKTFDDKYIVALILTYIRIQYFYVTLHDELARKWRELFKTYMKDFRKLKAVDFEQDCWSQSQKINVKVTHLDELIDWLVTETQIWGIPLGMCQWCNIYNDSDDSDDSEESE
ncbi:U4/U6-U5 snRNP complex subunit PRP38 KNAG_0K00980 [Huiozyma naganishii CBS 8797]|uniref:Pre-mRNA-splicing factor 38 n=1 Tax=Huiozyma naganishii (strain ATCC MYA-139 / BCRC 22969 / CBS 8797 / KCTC 17520 / NBRC 10181 / NCYC 3082 / Yp74L-3) TaxID=1071383 RepID=J7RRK2_HUIN7|nr:hypothetical protein KNAG_0K00980 [Kazachstania naganishii CBS 8797]CCK72463.1 hypothetical protein KNAG_0K00980 [Kazachstania naganishii CBS 8797]